MSDYVESHGLSLQELRDAKKSAELHHLRIYAGPGASPENKSWAVVHHAEEDDPSPEVHVFEDGHEMLAHVAHHACVDEEEG